MIKTQINLLSQLSLLLFQPLERKGAVYNIPLTMTQEWSKVRQNKSQRQTGRSNQELSPHESCQKAALLIFFSKLKHDLCSHTSAWSVIHAQQQQKKEKKKNQLNSKPAPGGGSFTGTSQHCRLNKLPAGSEAWELGYNLPRLSNNRSRKYWEPSLDTEENESYV